MNGKGWIGLKIRQISHKEDMDSVHAIRKLVFVKEQGVAPDLEEDGHDGEANHYLVFVDDKPVGTARWRITEHGYKLERFAVLDEYRGKGIGSALLKKMLKDVPVDKNRPVYLNAQLSAVAFYEKSGFVAVGHRFEEAGIQHYKMLKTPKKAKE